MTFAEFREILGKSQFKIEAEEVNVENLYDDPENMIY